MEIYNNQEFCAACYFRTIADLPHRKIILQLTERCNLHCVHCFVTAGQQGSEMPFEKIRDVLLPKLVRDGFTKVTLTGGEPFVYSRLLDVISLLRGKDIEVAICTNGTLISDGFIAKVKSLGGVHFNISLDGFSKESYSKFRRPENPKEFDVVISNIRKVAKAHLLKGILVTPNVYSSVSEYVSLCKFARSIGAQYVLMNPLSSFGRGVSHKEIGFSRPQMIELKKQTEKFSDGQMEMVYIRFPNVNYKPLGTCHIGEIPYTFASGEVSVCPYLSFNVTKDSEHSSAKSFIACNVFDPASELSASLDHYSSPFKRKAICKDCHFDRCGGGCPAIKIAKKENPLGPDSDLCPKIRGK
jgi:radical SAM protein with 4Fe4S-binding SPASM domain